MRERHRCPTLVKTVAEHVSNGYLNGYLLTAHSVEYASKDA